MSQVELWLRRPQNLWLRRAVFQIHLWSGIILGIYIFLVSVSGSAIVFRNELYNLLSARTRVNVSGEPLTREQMIGPSSAPTQGIPFNRSTAAGLRKKPPTFPSPRGGFTKNAFSTLF